MMARKRKGKKKEKDRVLCFSISLSDLFSRSGVKPLYSTAAAVEERVLILIIRTIQQHQQQLPVCFSMSFVAVDDDVSPSIERWLLVTFFFSLEVSGWVANVLLIDLM